MKRSKSIKLLLLGAASIILAGCEEEAPQQVSVFKSADDCVESKLMTPEQCKSAFDTAATEHEKVAPKFNSRELCEQEFGAGQCSPRHTADSGDVFLPMMTGFMAAQVLNSINNNNCNPNNYNCGGNGYVPQPLYRSTSDYGGYRTAGNYRVSDVSTRTASVSPSYSRSPVVTSSIKSSGGFGSQAAARASWGGSMSSSSGG